MSTEHRVTFHHGANLWIVVEADRKNHRERWSKGGWYNCSDAERAMTEGGFEWEEWSLGAETTPTQPGIGGTEPMERVKLTRDDRIR